MKCQTSSFRSWICTFLTVGQVGWGFWEVKSGIASLETITLNPLLSAFQNQPVPSMGSHVIPALSSFVFVRKLSRVSILG